MKKKEKLKRRPFIILARVVRHDNLIYFFLAFFSLSMLCNF